VARISAGNKCYYSLTKILSSRSLVRALKKQLYYVTLNRTICKSYRVQSGNTGVEEISRERAFLILERKIFGPTKDDTSGVEKCRAKVVSETRIHAEKELRGLHTRRENVIKIRERKLPRKGL